MRCINWAQNQNDQNCLGLSCYEIFLMIQAKKKSITGYSEIIIGFKMLYSYAVLLSCYCKSFVILNLIKNENILP